MSAAPAGQTTEDLSILLDNNITTDKSIDFESINEILEKVFKHEGFRTELQRDAVSEACSFRRDLFVSLPTGSGKSLIYQLPALFKNYGLTIVVSPLVALISNQITNARKLGIPCVTINSHMSKTWNSQVKDELKSKNMKLRLLYITPESLCSDHFQPYLNVLNKNRNLKLIAIDEAHCVSSWGHEFRPDYLKLGQLRTRYPEVPIVALTATATSKVLKDILDVLKLREPKHIVASTFRKNLFYDVRNVDEISGDVMNDLANLIGDALKLKRESDLAKSNSEAKRKKLGSKLSQLRHQFQEERRQLSGSGSQFVSAAALLSTSDAQPKKPKVKKETETKILAKETARITSFFKPKPIEVIDLCDDGEDDTDNMSKVTGAPPRPVKTKNKRPISPEPESQPVPKLESTGVGIVYCRTKVTCEDVAAHLTGKGIPARPYHSGLTSKERAEIEKLWMEEKVLVICATISFGMGIDKANVRVVVHFNMSQSLANYYQESGRAGRDGKKAWCRLYYSRSDQGAITFLLRKDLESEDSKQNVEKFGVELSKKKQHTARAAMERFEKMVEYCKSSNKCRHLILAREFALANESRLLINGCGKSCDCCCFRSRIKSMHGGRN